MGSTSLTPLSFTGLSQFSTDFQTILTRAVSIAQLPITALQNKQSDTLQEEQLATGLQNAVAALATTVTNLGNLGTNQGMTGSSSDPTKVVVNNTSLTAPASYAITNITSVATAASASTVSGYADATTASVSASGTMQLKINGVAVAPNIDLTGAGKNNLNGLAAAINNLNAGVTASVINTGTGATPYYLSISDNSTGQNTISLAENPNGANTAVALNTTAGANADFFVNGEHVTSATNTLSGVIPGMTFTITGQTSASQTVTLATAPSPAQISSQLQNFVTQYNAVQGLLNAQIGPAAGLLSGNSMIFGVGSAMQGLLNYENSGTVQNISDLGIEMDDTGKMSLNQTTFNSLTSSQITAAFSFLGSATTGFGALASRLTQYSDPVNGAIKTQQDQFNTTYTNLGTQVTALTDRATLMQQTLSAKLQEADALIAGMQSQQQLLTASIQSLNFASFGFSNNNTSSFSPSSNSSSTGG